MKKRKLLLVNIAGFTSTGNNKSTQLQEMFPDAKVMNYITSGQNPIELINRIAKETSQEEEKDDRFQRIFIGSSLGGFYAHHISSWTESCTILINPSMRPWRTLKHYIGLNTFRHRTKFGGTTFELKQSDLNEMQELCNQYDETENNICMALFLGGKDTVLDHNYTRAVLKHPFMTCTMSDFDHRFEDISIVKSCIEYMQNKEIIHDDTCEPVLEELWNEMVVEKNKG